MTLVEVLKKKATDIKHKEEKREADQKYWVQQVDGKFKQIDEWLNPLVEANLATINEPDDRDLLEESDDDGELISRQKGKEILLLNRKSILILDKGIDILSGFGRIDFEFNKNITMLVLVSKEKENWILRSLYEEDEREFNGGSFESLINHYITEL